jgi:two-component system response regulator RpfG
MSTIGQSDNKILKNMMMPEILNHKNRQVVIVDDESTGRTILSKILENVVDNVEIVAFEKPQAALEWIQNNQPHLIITDYRMPELNGVEFIQEVRKIPNCYNTPIMMISVVSEKEVRYEALEAGATAFLTRPIDQVECSTSCRNLLKMHEQHLTIQNRADWLAQQVDVATQQIQLRERETILRLAKAGEYRDEETGNHVIRMSKYSRLIAEELGLPESQCDDIEYAAPMHDIGKIGIPDGVLLKPGKLDPREWEVMQSHTSIGYSILSNSQSKYMQMGAVIALYHHERFDGRGYPNGLHGEDIPLIARIVAVADVYDALVSVRPYKPAWPIEEAVEYIQKQAGTQLDPACVEAFCKRLSDVANIQSNYADDESELHRTME